MSFLRQIFGGKGKATAGNGGALLRLRSQLVGSPLAIEPSRVEVFLASLANAQHPDVKTEVVTEDAGRLTAASSMPMVAIVPVRGVLIQRSMGELLDWWFGVVGYDTIRAHLEDALADESVREIVLDIDSPGGMVSGLQALADFIAAARNVKPITAVVDEQAMSAAYWLASSCTRIVAPETAQVGSIGVISTHTDWSAWNERVGLKITHIFAGARKADFSPDLQLAPEAIADQQAKVDALYGMFVGAVSARRGIGEDAVRGTEARVYLAREALAIGLIDEIATAEAAKAAALERATKPVEPEEAPIEEQPAEDPPSVPEEAPTDSEPVPVDEPEPEAVSAPPTVQAQIAAAVAGERSRIAAIGNVCAAFGVPDLAVKLVSSGASVEAARIQASHFAALQGPVIHADVDPMADAGPSASALLLAAVKRRNERKSR